MKKDRGFTFVDDCACLGGMRLGLEWAGGRCVASSEKEECCWPNYAANFGGDRPAADIGDFDVGKLTDAGMLAAGFPCTSWSVSGTQKGFCHTDGNVLVTLVSKIRLTGPLSLLLENVPNFINHAGGHSFRWLCAQLEAAGYDVYWRRLNCCHFGLPVSRERLFLVAFKKSLKVRGFQFPQPTFEPCSLTDVLLPDDETDRYVVERDYHWKTRHTEAYRRNGPKVGAPTRLGTYAHGQQGSRVYAGDGIAACYQAEAWRPGGCSALYVINGRVRSLAPREMASSLGYPESFHLPEDERLATWMLGKTVSPVIVRLTAERMAAKLPRPRRSMKASSRQTGRTASGPTRTRTTTASARWGCSEKQIN